MGIFAKDEFRPNCRPVEGSNGQRRVLSCRPTLKRGDQVLGGDRETQVILEGKDIIITDDGGVPDEVREKLIRSLKGM